MPYSLRALSGRLELACALTVHKAQGGELDEAVVLLPEDDMPLCCRELIYTAMTRAKKSVVIVGDHERLAFAVANPERRYSGLRDALESEAQPDVPANDERESP